MTTVKNIYEEDERKKYYYVNSQDISNSGGTSGNDDTTVECFVNMDASDSSETIVYPKQIFDLVSNVCYGAR